MTENYEHSEFSVYNLDVMKDTIHLYKSFKKSRRRVFFTNLLVLLSVKATKRVRNYNYALSLLASVFSS